MKKYLICDVCKNVVTYVEDHGVPIACCGSNMKVLTANTVDAAVEKHVPVVKVDGNNVNVFVGDVEHPMTAEHYITWIAMETNQGQTIKNLTPDSKPEANFVLAEGEELVAINAYCNLHGLWTNK